ncbi:MAG: prolyl oligopeptidase family serine peptidase [Pseudomonadota bacterium]
MLNILRLSLCALACAAATAALAAEPTPGHRLNHANLWLIKRVGAPVLSPDGERAVFNLSEPAYAAKDARSDLWTALKRQQVPSRLIVFPEANHWILRAEDSRYFYSEVAAWLARYLRPDEATAPH